MSADGIALTFISIIVSVLLGLAVHHHEKRPIMPIRHFG